MDKITLLLIEDNSGEAEMITEMLSNSQYRDDFRLIHRSLAAEGLVCLARENIDAVLLDLTLPDSQGFETFDKVHQQAPDVPIVVFTGLNNDRTAIQTLQSGAQDYLVKGQVGGETIVRSIRYAIERQRLSGELERKTQQLQTSEQRLRQIIDHNADGIIILQQDSIVQFLNPAAEALLGTDSSSIIGRLFPYAHQIKEAESVEITIRPHKDNPGRRGIVTAEMRSVRIEWEGKPALLASLRDITCRKQAESVLWLTANVFENAGEGIMVTNERGRLLRVNRAFTEITGYSQKDAIGRNSNILKSGQHDESFYGKIWASLRESGKWQGEIWNRRKNGEIYPQWLTISSIQSQQGEVRNYVGIFSDITVRKANEQRLSYLASHDVLTGLPNRALFTDRLERAILRAQRKSHMVGVIFLDLDDFKPVNDTYGHLVGDHLLQALAVRLKSSARKSDTIARLGGDEFTLILEDCSDDCHIENMAQKILHSVAAPYKIDGHQISVTVSLGISIYPDHGNEYTTLLEKADQAMYAAKRSGKNHYTIYDQQQL